MPLVVWFSISALLTLVRAVSWYQSFLESFKEVKSQALISPFISIDQEGGRVERTEAIRPKRLSAKYAFERGEDYLKIQSSEISKELADWGFNLNFAPCIDVNSNSQNPIIGERAFSNNPEDVIKGMKIFVEELRRNNVIPCVKHYPGHGDADKDSHLTLPRINLTFDEMIQKIGAVINALNNIYVKGEQNLANLSGSITVLKEVFEQINACEFTNNKEVKNKK